MISREEIVHEVRGLNEAFMSNESIRANFKSDILIELALDIRDLLTHLLPEETKND